jgi:hypothetical protein
MTGSDSLFSGDQTLTKRQSSLPLLGCGQALPKDKALNVSDQIFAGWGARHLSFPDGDSA